MKAISLSRTLTAFLCALLMGLAFTSCDKDEDDGPDYSKYEPLFSTVDVFVSKLDYSSSYSYPISGSAARTTSDFKFVVTPIGRLIGVKPKKTMLNSELETVKDALEWKFGSMYVVKEIYLNTGGGITLDCRR